VASAETPYEAIILKFHELTVGPDGGDLSHPVIQEKLEDIASTCEEFQALLIPGTERDRVFSDLPLVDIRLSAAISTTTDRLAKMADGWATPGSRLWHDTVVGEQIIAGLQTVHDLQYHVGQLPFDNWYTWEIGTPRQMMKAAVLIRSIMPAELWSSLSSAFLYFNPDPAYRRSGQKMTGSNLMLRCQNAIVAGALNESDEQIQLARDASVEALAPNTTGEGDGFYFDGSFIAHVDVPYTATYGRELLTSASTVVPLLNDSPWAYADDAITPLRAAIYRNFLPWISNMQYLPPTRGRSVATGTGNANWTLSTILLLAEGAPSDQAELWRSAVKGHLERCTIFSIFDRFLPEVRLALRVLTSDEIPARPEDLGPRLFPEMDRILSRGAGWCVSLATGSARTRGFETAVSSTENIKGWHQGSGARYLMLDHDENQHPHLFPTLDPYRIPGTTIDKQELPPSTYESGKTRDAFVGGVQTGGRREADGFYTEPLFASWVQALSSQESTMTAKLSWFFLGSRIVHLGADIRGGSGAPIESVIENRALTIGNQVLSINGTAIPAAGTTGWTATRDDVRTVHISDVVGIVMIGSSGQMNFLRDHRQGSFKDLSPLKGSATLHTNDFFTVWLDHGPTPDGADFAYLYLPLASVAETEAMAQDPGVVILANTAEVQAVQSPADRLVAAHFHQESEVRSGCTTIAAAKETCVMVRVRNQRRDVLDVSVSDPTQARDAFTVTITDPRLVGGSVLEADPTITASLAARSMVITVDASARDGSSHHLSVGL